MVRTSSSLSQAPKRRARTRMVSRLPGDSFFGNDQSDTSSVTSDLSLNSSSRSLASASSSSSGSSQSRPRRLRIPTLLPGSSVHDAFFGSDETVRDNFDQDAAIREIAYDRSYSRTTTSHLKPGRPIVPRYAEF